MPEKCYQLVSSVRKAWDGTPIEGFATKLFSRKKSESVEGAVSRALTLGYTMACRHCHAHAGTMWTRDMDSRERDGKARSNHSWTCEEHGAPMAIGAPGREWERRCSDCWALDHVTGGLCPNSLTQF